MKTAEQRGAELDAMTLRALNRALAKCDEIGKIIGNRQLELSARQRDLLFQYLTPLQDELTRQTKYFKGSN